MSDTTWRLVTVNTAPERAKRLIGRVAEELKDRYTIIHVANADCKDVTLDLSEWKRSLTYHSDRASRGYSGGTQAECFSKAPFKFEALCVRY